MTPKPLDYGTAADPARRGMPARCWALLLAVAACVVDTISFLVGAIGGGKGWAMALLFLWSSALLALVLAAVSTCIGIATIIRRERSDPFAWLAVLLATAAVCSALLIAKWSAEASAAV